MSMKHLGESFDIHTGGVDLIFPHHEDEIAQSEAATGHRVRPDLAALRPPPDGRREDGQVDRQHRPRRRSARAAASRRGRCATPCIAVHYRAPLTYSDESLAAATAAIERLDAVLLALAGYREDRPDDPSLAEAVEAARTAFGAALDDDLNVSPALAALFDLVREVNRRIDARTMSTADAALASGRHRRARRRARDRARGRLGGARAGASGAPRRAISAREARDWATSDRLRDELAAAGILVEDSRDGQRWRRAEGVRGG